MQIITKLFYLYFPPMHSSSSTSKINVIVVTPVTHLHVFLIFCTRWISFFVSFHTGRESGTITYNDSLRYFKTAKHMSILGMEAMLPTEENADGTLHRFTRKRHADVSRCKWLRYGLLYGILNTSCAKNPTNKAENHKLL